MDRVAPVGIEVLVCPKCSGFCRVLAAIQDPAEVLRRTCEAPWQRQCDVPFEPRPQARSIDPAGQLRRTAAAQTMREPKCMADTADLLLRWARGDQNALAELVAQDAPWIERQVRSQLGNHLRQRADTQDILQETLLTILRTGPRFVCSDRAHLRALLARMLLNTIHAEAHHQTAKKRDLRREVAPAHPGSAGSVLILDQQAGSSAGPGSAAAEAETRDWLRLALELLEPDDRNTILWREYEGISFADVGARLGVAEDAARMRFQRALPKLAKKMKALRAGEIGKLLASDR